MKTKDDNGVKDHMAEMFKFAIVRHIDKLNQERKSFTQVYGLDESNGLYLDNYVEFVYTKVNSMVSQYEENKNSETVEEMGLTIRWTRDASCQSFPFLKGREGKEQRWKSLTESLFKNRIFEKVMSANPNAHRATEYALTPEFMETFIETAIRKKQLLKRRDVIKLIKRNDIDAELLQDVVSTGNENDINMTKEGRKMYDFMLRLAFINDMRMHKVVWMEFLYVFIALRDFVFKNKFVTEYGPNKRIYTPFSALDKEARPLFGLQDTGIKELRWIDGVSTYPSLLARLLMLYYPNSTSCKKFLAITTDRRQDFYSTLVRLAKEQGLKKKIGGSADSLASQDYTRKEMKTMFMKYLFGMRGEKTLDQIFATEFKTVHVFVQRFRFSRKVGHSQIEVNAQRLAEFLDRKNILSTHFPEVKSLLDKYFTTFNEEGEERQLIADEDYDGKEKRHPHALSYMLEHLETNLFKDVLRRDTSGKVYMLHDSLGFPEGEERRYYQMLCESADRLKWKGFLVHLEYWDRAEHEMVTDPNKSRWPRELNLKQVKYNQRHYQNSKAVRSGKNSIR